MKKAYILLALVCSTFVGYAQMNIQQLKAQVPQLKLPFEAPKNIPPSVWEEEEISLSTYPYVKKEITELYMASTYSSGDYDRFYGIGYISLGEATALVYLWSNIDQYDGMTRYSIRMDTYDQKGEFVDHAIICMENSYSVHGDDPDYFGAPEEMLTKDYCDIYTDKNTFYLKRTIETEINRIIEIENGNEYYTENQLINSNKSFDLLEMFSNGKIIALYKEEE